MEYTLLVQRMSEHKDVKKPGVEKVEDSTLSNVTLVDAEGKELFKCYCCENIGPSTDTPMMDRRIVAREYYLEWTGSSKNGSLSKKYPKWKCKNGRNKALWIKCAEKVEFGKRRILIHAGNYPQDTEGCLLFGYGRSSGAVSNSVECINDFFTLVESLKVESIKLVIREVSNV